MFDFKNLEVYKKAKAFNSIVGKMILTSRFSKPDRKNFCVVARGPVFECVAVFDIMKDEGQLTPDLFTTLYKQAEEISKMLFAMIRNLEG